MAVHKIVFLRHGESVWNVENIFTGWQDVDLSERGQQEAVEAGKCLKEKGFKFDVVFTSVLRRAIKTAWTALAHSDNFSMPVISTWRLNERHYGGLQGLNKAETAKKHGDEQVKIWRRSYDIPPPEIDPSDPRHPCNEPKYAHVPRTALPGAESLKLTVERVLPFWSDQIAPCVMAGKSVLVSAHGNSLRAICKFLEGMSEEEVLEFNIPTAVPLVYELDEELRFIRKYYLMDEAEVKAKIAAVAAQGSAGAQAKPAAPLGVPKATDPKMSPAAMKLLLVRPKVPAPLDPNFAPVVLGLQNYLEAAKGCQDKLEWALPRADGVGRGSLPVFPDDHPDVDASIHLAGVQIQQMFWERSASSLLLCGPARVTQAVKQAFSLDGKYAFEVRTMPKVCGTPDAPFEVRIVGSVDELPQAYDTPVVCGQDASGCRLAFDLGKSDIKTVAVKDNEVLSSKETEWDVTNPDPAYHWEKILTAMKETASHLPRVEAIGGSATGTISGDNGATWCDIFPNVPPDVYREKVVPIFRNLAKEFGDVPLKVINDGEVTAIAGALMVKEGNLLGISMGSSEGGGYCNADKNLLGWINELCYIQLDLNPEAPTDPWTNGHTGISHMYLGQRGATKLAAKAGVDVPDDMRPEHPNMNTMRHESHAKCLKLIQAAMKDPAKEPHVRQLYETVGVYLGYALAQYSSHYNIDNVIILGRVSTGEGGTIMCNKAKEVLETEFPELAHIKFHFPDEHFKRVGQCIAAAALPQL